MSEMQGKSARFLASGPPEVQVPCSRPHPKAGGHRPQTRVWELLQALSPGVAALSLGDRDCGLKQALSQLLLLPARVTVQVSVSVSQWGGCPQVAERATELGWVTHPHGAQLHPKQGSGGGAEDVLV